MKKPQRQQGERKRHPQLGPTPSNGQTRRKSGGWGEEESKKVERKRWEEGKILGSKRWLGEKGRAGKGKT